MYGFSLLEVLIGLFIFSLMILGFDGMELFSLHQSRSHYFFNLASMEMQSINERLIALQNHDGSKTQIMAWKNEIAETLPQGRGEVTGVYPNYLIKIYWGVSTEKCLSTYNDKSGCLWKKIII